MSASLVGSEMCIRDSCAGGTFREGSAGAVAPPERRRKKLLKARVKRVQRACLLYTSDAADDM
eukprot:6433560-Alexandrium_andersonii.AAC.1